MRTFFFSVLLLSLFACKKVDSTAKSENNFEKVKVEYADGFSIHLYENYTKVIVHSPWQDAENDIIYLIKEKAIDIPKDETYDVLIESPIENLVTTSTTHIPSLITLDKIDNLVGFPNLDYISSPEARQLIAEDKIKELGRNESLNTEVLLSVNPDVVFSFAIEGRNKTLNQIESAGIPVVYNGDWLENDVLGKAEWIKFFGAFLGELDKSIEAFEEVKTSYESIKEKVAKIQTRPSVISGAMHQDRWYLPYGTSWQGQLFKDANASYVYQNTSGKGSAAYSFEKVLEDAKDSDFWISPAQFTSYHQLEKSNVHYKEFKAFQEKNIFTMSTTTGETGGVLFYEVGPNRPDLVLKDLVKILHPDVFKNEEFTFFKPLDIE
jgi:iron complex transport system substrate-binding protein